MRELVHIVPVYDRGTTATTVEGVQRLFVSHGANEVYARIATTQKYRTGFGDHSMDRGLERARMAAALHLPFNPELGLFNTYGAAAARQILATGVQARFSTHVSGITSTQPAMAVAFFKAMKEGGFPVDELLLSTWPQRHSASSAARCSSPSFGYPAAGPCIARVGPYVAFRARWQGC